jgi:fatty-acyl-CoA synthase
MVRDELEARGLLDIVAKAFSSEVDTGSREENASKNKSSAS